MRNALIMSARIAVSRRPKSRYAATSVGVIGSRCFTMTALKSSRHDGNPSPPRLSKFKSSLAAFSLNGELRRGR
jgi:hypothetical protein